MPHWRGRMGAPGLTSTTRRSVLRLGLAGCLMGLCWPRSGAAASSGVTDSEIVLGMSAAFSGPSRGLGIELFRGASAYFEHINRQGGVRGRRVVLRTYDDGYQPDPSVQNTMTLMLEDEVFALFGYVGTPTVTRVLPMLKKFQERQVYLFFPVHRRPAAAGAAIRPLRLSTYAPPTGRRPRAWFKISSESAADGSASSIRPTLTAAAVGRACAVP